MEEKRQRFNMVAESSVEQQLFKAYKACDKPCKTQKSDFMNFMKWRIANPKKEL